MPRQKCSLCNESYARPMASVYWRWQWPSGDQRGYVQKFDPTCGASFFERLGDIQAENDECIWCKAQPKYPNEIYLKGYVYMPGHDRIDLELLHCEECFMKNEDLFTQGARRLDDRGVEGRGTPALNPADDPWAAIGLHP